MTALLRLPEVKRRTGLGKTTIYDRVQRGEFPAPIKYGCMTFWTEHELESWLLARITEGGGVEEERRG